jgi:hypothetical protein
MQLNPAAPAVHARPSAPAKYFAPPEGRSQNARTHGLTAAHLVIAPGEELDFEHLYSELHDAILPEGALELDLFAQLLHASWKLRRCNLAEATLVRDGLDPLLSDDPASQRKFDRIRRYRAAARRDYHRALAELRLLQTARYIQPPMDDRPPLADPLRKMQFARSHNLDARTLLKENLPSASPPGVIPAPPR